jgi:anti-anti-sigma factor
MQVKINTKEKFHVITILDENLSANMTADISNKLLPYLQNVVKNIVLKMENVKNLDHAAAETIAQIQQTYYEQNASFVICDLQKEVETELDKNELLDILNVTPSESEAWDIVQMEEIERDLLGGEE